MSTVPGGMWWGSGVYVPEVRPQLGHTPSSPTGVMQYGQYSLFKAVTSCKQSVD